MAGTTIGGKFGHVDVLVEAGAALREIGRGFTSGKHEGKRSLIDEAVYQVGQAVYGRNSLSPRLVRDGTRAALALVLRARKLKGAPEQLGTVATLLQTALRNTPKAGT